MGNVLKELCPEQSLETSAIALGLFGRLLCLREEAGEGRRDTLQVSGWTRQVCVIYYFRGQSEYVLKIVTVTPFRKVALVPKYQPCLVHRVLRAGKERQCTVAWSPWVFAVMHALLPTMHLLKTGKSCLCSSMQSCAATGLVQKCSPGASCFFPKRLGQSRAVIQAAAVHDKRLPVRSPARPSGPDDRNRWLGPVPCGPAIVRPIRGDVPSGLRHLPWGHSPVLGLPAARVYDSGPADGKP